MTTTQTTTRPPRAPAISRRNDPNAYRPAPNSKAHQVLLFFAQSPDEELTRKDLAIKFNMSESGIDTSLSACVQAELLRVKLTDDGRTWSAGPALADWRPTDVSDRARPGGPKASRLPLLDMAKVTLRTDLPVPSRASNKGATLYDPLLEKLTDVGMAATFPRPYAASIAKASQTFGKRFTPPRKYAIRVVDAQQCGVWRVA
jgi:hypothetical protein